jgi:hypothetical protein
MVRQQQRVEQDHLNVVDPMITYRHLSMGRGREISKTAKKRNAFTLRETPGHQARVETRWSGADSAPAGAAFLSQPQAAVKSVYALRLDNSLVLQRFSVT